MQSWRSAGWSRIGFRSTSGSKATLPGWTPPQAACAIGISTSRFRSSASAAWPRPSGAAAATSDPAGPGCRFSRTCRFSRGYGNRSSAIADGLTFIGTVGIRYQLPGQTARFRPYLSGGLGINNTDQELRIEPFGIDASSSRTGYAFDAGAGASLRVAGGFGLTWTRNTSGSRAIATSCVSAGRQFPVLDVVVVRTFRSAPPA